MARTKEFDEDAVLVKAMKLFWEQGYEKTSMAELVERMGIHKRSMYDTFGDKHSLYLMALQRYRELIERTSQRIVESAASAEEAIRLWLRLAVDRDESVYPQGCLMVNTAVELAPHDEESKTRVNDSFAGYERLIREEIEKGQRSGELDRSLDAEALSHYFHNAFTGLLVMAKSTDDREKLNRIIDTTMGVLKRG